MAKRCFFCLRVLHKTKYICKVLVSQLSTRQYGFDGKKTKVKSCDVFACNIVSRFYSQSVKFKKLLSAKINA